MSHAATFRALHFSDRLLVLANAWDAASARVVEAAGARALATSSASVAWAHGYGDGQQLPLDTLLQSVRAIVRVVHLPLTVDFEQGWSAAPEAIGDHVAALVDAGAVGCNLEDGHDAPEALATRIAVAKASAARAGKELFVNARCDVYLHKLASGEAALAETLRRARLYREAGADGLFVPDLLEPAAIDTVVREIPLPLNLLARPALGPVAELERLGVRRLSVGGALALAAFGATHTIVRELVTRGSYDSLFAQQPPALSGAQLNGWFAAR